MAMGIDKYNAECRSIVMKYSHEWERTVKRAGRWIDMENDWKTLNIDFMESVWWVFKQLFEKGQVYRGFKVGFIIILPHFSYDVSYSLISFAFLTRNGNTISDHALLHGLPHPSFQL